MSEFWGNLLEFFGYFQPENIIKYGGLLLLLTVVFIENGLFFGFFLPGDSLLFTAGLLCATKVLPHSLGTILLSVFLVSVMGNVVGYYFGKKAGERLHNRKRSFFFRPNHLLAAEVFFAKYGLRTLIIGRFLPVIRTFAPIVAGMIKMKWGYFMIGNISGAAFWVGSLITAGYYLGIFWPESENYLGYIIIFLIIITALPVIRTLMNSKQKKV